MQKVERKILSDLRYILTVQRVCSYGIALEMLLIGDCVLFQNMTFTI